MQYLIFICALLMMIGCGKTTVIEEPLSSSPQTPIVSGVTEMIETKTDSIDDAVSKKPATLLPQYTWKTEPFADLTLHIFYPDDPHFQLIKLSPDHTIIEHSDGSQRIHILKNSSHELVQKNAKKKNINGFEYEVFSRAGSNNPYGYVTRVNNDKYIFESIGGPENLFFEEFMKRIRYK